MENENVEKISAEEKKEELTQEEFAEIEKKFKKYSDVEDLFHNGLIGYFENGKYVIDDDVKDDLKKINKTLDNKDEKNIWCHAKHHDFIFNFVVEMEKLSAFSTAKLYLLEEKEEDDEIKKFKTLISTEVTSSDVDIEARAMKVWHIFLEDTPNELELSALDSIIIRLSKDRIYGKDLVEVLAQLYNIQMLKFLDGLGESGKEIIKEYNEFVRLMAIKKPSIMNSNVNLKNLLDKILAENELVAKIKVEHAKEIANIYKEFYEPLEKISVKKEKSMETEKAPRAVENVEMKKEEKKPAKPVGKSKGEKPYYPKPAKPGKVTSFPKLKASGGAGVSKIKPTELKTPTPPKMETPKQATPPGAKPVEKSTIENPQKTKVSVNELGDLFDDSLQTENEQQLSETFDNVLKNEGKENLGDTIDHSLKDKGVLEKNVKDKNNDKYLDL